MELIKASEYTKFFWTEYQINSYGTDYNLVFQFTISGQLDINQLAKSVWELIEKQSLLNYHLIFSKGELFWCPMESISPLETFDTIESQHQFIHFPFNLKKGPLYRFGLFTIASNKYNLVFVFHRAIFELQPYRHLFKIISELYANKKIQYFSKQRQIEIINSSRQELDERVKILDMRAACDFWQTALKSSTQQNNFPDCSTNSTNHAEFGMHTFSICTNELKFHNLGSNRYSFHSLFLSVYGLLIHTYFNTETITIGHFLDLNQSNDPSIRGQENLILIPITIHHDYTLESLLGSINLHLERCLNPQTLYGYLPTTSILSEANVTNPNLFFVETPTIEDLLDFEGCKVTLNNQLNFDTLNADLVLNFNRTEHGVNFSFKYKESQFSTEFVHQLSKTFCYLLKNFIKKNFMKEKISNIPLLDASQYKQIVLNWNQTLNEHQNKLIIHELIEEQAELTPNNIAVIFQNKKLTYHQLNHQANTLALQIISNQQINDEEFIVLFLNRSEMILPAILGVLKSGKAYVPIDTQYPNDRILFILEDTKSKCIITDQYSKQKLINILNLEPQLSNVIILTIEEVLRKSVLTKTENLKLDIQGSDLAYVLYTSGTTGTPKGVMIEHTGVANLALTHADMFGLKNTNPKQCLWFSNYVFDAHISEIYAPIIYGHILHVASNDIRYDVQKLHNYINQHKIYLATIPPTLLSEHDIFNVEVLVIAGDTAPKQIFDKYYNKKVTVFNAYGPTESTVCLSLNRYQNNGATNIGKPISNMTAYVLSPHLKPLPPGVTGELYIGGIGLARGYLNNQKLTEEHFVLNPFFSIRHHQIFPSKHLYRTGDLVRWRTDGSLEYIGRNDFQVKIRGHRVELQEIEKAITSFPGVNQCVVLSKESTDSENYKYLIGYYVVDFIINKEELLDYLNSKLPYYMIPSSLVNSDKFPLTSNGKIDRNVLAKITPKNNHEYIPPRNETEKALCNIFSEVLDLPLESVGITNNFFELGGDSIFSLQLINKIREKLEIQINFEIIYNHKTIKNLYEDVFKNNLKKQHAPQEIEVTSLSNKTQPNIVGQFLSSDYFNELSKNNEIEGLYLANSLQQGFIYHYLNQGDVDNAYVIQLCWEYSTDIKPNILKKAWLCAQKKYSGLRLRFDWEEAFIQIIEKKQKFNWKFIDVSDKIRSDQTQKINDLKQKDYKKKYDLKNGSLFRVCLAKQSDSSFTCVFSAHHAILDGWSIPILLNYVHNSYIQLLNNQTPDTSIDLCYASAQNFIQTNHEHMLKEFENYLSTTEDGDALGLLINRNVVNNIQDYRQIQSQKTKTLCVKDALYHTLKSLGNNEGITLNATIQFAWHKVLSVFCNTSETVVGTIVAGRSLPIKNIETSVGLYINTLPMVVNHTKPQSILAALKSIQTNIWNINTNSAVHLSDLQNNTNKIFNSLFVFENYPSRERLFSDTTLKHRPRNWQDKLKINFQDYKNDVNYPLSLMVSDLNSLLEFKISYQSELFTEELIENLLETLQLILEQLQTNNLSKSTTSLKYVNQKQQSQLLQQSFIDIKKQNETIHSVFESHALYSPDAPALITLHQKISYQKLNMQANELAHYLITLQLSKENSLIAVYLEDKESIITSMLAILKSGAAYVPIDIHSPLERLTYILENTKADVILTCTKHEKTLRKIVQNSKLLKASSQKIININKINDILSFLQKTNPDVNLSANNLAYVIYTSGSTGKPKGVMIKHQGVVSLVKNINYINLSSNDIFIQLSDIAFDAATFEIWAPLLNGAQLFIPQDSLKLFANYRDFKVTLKKQRISIMWLTKTLFDQLILLDISMFQNLRYLLVGGEALNKKLITKLLNSNFAPQNIINGYGPTENTTFSCTYNLKDLKTSLCASVPIGKPLTNRTAFILSNNQSLLPVGAIGELYLGGAGLASGYLNDLYLTNERFILNPFTEQNTLSQSTSQKLYKSGDLARWLSDGHLEFLGRKDRQIKIRGFRVELTEIEKEILSYPEVSQVAVLVKEISTKDDATNKLLFAFYCSPKAIENTILQSFLKKKLPDYMIPNAFIHLTRLPHTENGKLDDKSLLSIETSLTTNNNYNPPKTPLEKLICSIWAEVLGVEAEKIGTKSDFFELGGNSLLSVTLLNKLNKEIKQVKNNFVEITLPELLRAKTIKNLIKQLSLQKNNSVNEDVFKQDTTLDPSIRPTRSIKVPTTPPSFLLTGATGLLGSHILHKLLKSDIQLVYCLIRESKIERAYEKLKHTFLKNNFDCKLLNQPKLKLVLGDFSKPNFSLSISEFTELAQKTDVIIHNGAEVNHIYPYELLRESNVKSTEYMLKFASIEKIKAINYVSTLSVLESNLNQSSTLGESSDLSCINLDHGYVSTKLASEILLNKAKSRGFKINIFRPSLFFHEKNGFFVFNENNHFYSFLSSIIQLKKYPRVDLTFDILPIDFISECIIKISPAHQIRQNIFNLTNPNKISLKTLVEHLKREQIFLEAVSIADWAQEIHNTNNNLSKFASLYSTNSMLSGQKRQTSQIPGIDHGILNELGLKITTISPQSIIQSILNRSTSDHG